MRDFVVVVVSMPQLYITVGSYTRTWTICQPLSKTCKKL